ncbi:hypothetical protein SEVIR_2G451900v4 [Setaria viridis]|uniref:VQ domain-containing protein n=2 Tax=Setaria TaxID=4554 RepID=K3ZWZ9_SETIT|nr:calmodulin-binding protein 25 [Setaria italica]XP_034580634.1 calmodulin-binding protein 25-like [Setaria viridis]RCV14612.1 hypothetical protein SETIT_2G439500v2 [Setaria italica]TKW36620.1 hypothetical protein SEVIR_2G451900v2 [Setaria viridis]
MDAISCLPPPAALLATSFADAAIARALHFSISSADSASSSSSLSAPPPAAYYAPPHVTTTCCDSVLVADSPMAGRRQHKQQLAPAGGRAGKRRSRASKRAPTTYISTDPANFRIMVQQITGVQADIEMLHPTATTAIDAAAAVLMAADASASATVGAYGGNPLQLPVPGGDEASATLHHHQQLQQPCFPTLDSWNVMYERSELL